MNSSPRFSEVSTVYNQHIASLDRARRVFESEVEVLNDHVFKHLEDRRSWPVDGVRKVRWGKPEPWSSAREVSWLNWVSATRLRMDIKPPEFKNFKKAAAYVFFQTSFDPDLSKFVFACRLENQNSVNAELDEAVIELVTARSEAEFPRAVHVKRNRALLYRCTLEDSIYDEVNEWIDRGLEVITDAVDHLFPDALYSLGTGSEELDGDDAELVEEEDSSELV